MDSHLYWVCLLCRCPPLWKSTTLPLTYASMWWDRRRGGSTSDSPRCCCGSCALDLKSGLGSSFNPALTYELEMRIDNRAGEILGHKVCRIIGSENLSHFELMEILFLLNPQGGNVDVSEFASTFAVRNR